MKFRTLDQSIEKESPAIAARIRENGDGLAATRSGRKHQLKDVFLTSLQRYFMSLVQLKKIAGRFLRALSTSFKL